MPVIAARDIEKSYGARAVLSAATLTIRSGERVGLVGRNGAGKSTLVRILAGQEPPDGGELAVRRGATIGLLEQVPDLPAGQSARTVVSEGLAAWRATKDEETAVTEALATADGASRDALLARQAELHEQLTRLGGWDRSHEVEAMLGHLGVADIDRDVATMSGGERRRVALARLLVATPSLAILDEPTNHLDVETIDWLEEFLNETYTGAVLLVTHDRYLLDRVCTRTLEIADGKLTSYEGGYETFLEAKATRQALEERTEQNRQNFLRRELEWLARQPKARTTKQKARIERAETAKAAVPRKKDEAIELEALETRAGKTILELEGFGLDVAGRTLIGSLDLYVTEGERIGVVGKNGTGKTSLLRAVIGELPPTRGRLTRGKNTKVSYFDQERTGLDPDKTIFENVGASGAVEIGGEKIEARAYLERFLFDGHAQRQKVSSLSGGERARAALAKTLKERTNLLLLDEPTNDLDVDTLAALEEMLVSYGGAALVVTHDRFFLDRIATALLVFEEGGRVTKYPGNYETYRRLRDEARAAEKEKSAGARDAKAAKEGAKDAAKDAAPTSAKGASTPPAKTKLSYKERLELEGLPARIEETEALVAKLEGELGAPDLYKEGPERLRTLTAEHEAKKALLAELYVRWELLEGRSAG